SSLASPSSRMNSKVAPRAAAALLASAVRLEGDPLLPASPREQTTRCAARPPATSRATIPPQPNSPSSGCAQNARSGAGSRGDLAVGFIGAVDRVPVHEGDLRRILPAEVGLLAGARDVVGAVQNGLHPSQAGVAGGADLGLVKGGGRQADE